MFINRGGKLSRICLTLNENLRSRFINRKEYFTSFLLFLSQEFSLYYQLLSNKISCLLCDISLPNHEKSIENGKLFK